MATKTKTTETSASAAALPVEQVISEGLEHLNAGRLIEAATAFKRVQAEAAEQELISIGRAARGYLAAIQARLEEQGEPSKETPELTGQLLLNRHEPEQALACLDQALAAQPERASLHYLKAVAHAQLGQGPESAEALAKAVAIDADFLFQFRLEPDFDSLRHAGPFASLLRG